MKKTCTRCALVKPRSDFYFWRGRIKGECKDCTKRLANERRATFGRSGSLEKAIAARKRKYAKAKERAVDGRTEGSFTQRFRRHGLTVDSYHSIAERQDFLCAMCSEEPKPQNERKGNVDNFVIDHDHQTGRVRGLLCWTCNAALGSLRDCPNVARHAATYLDKHHALRAAA